MNKPTVILILAIIAIFITGCGITTTVKDKDTGQPVYMVNLKIEEPNGKTDLVVTDKDGQGYYRPGLLGSYTITPSKNGYTFEPSQKTLIVTGMVDLKANFKAIVSGGSEPEPVADEVIWRFWNGTDHLYNAGYIDANPYGYKVEGIAFVADRYSNSTNSPVYRYYDKNATDHFFSTEYMASPPSHIVLEKNPNTGDNPYFYAYSASTSGNSVPIYEYWSESIGDHLYTHQYFGNPVFGYAIQNNKQPVFYARDPGRQLTFENATAFRAFYDVIIPAMRSHWQWGFANVSYPYNIAYRCPDGGSGVPYCMSFWSSCSPDTYIVYGGSSLSGRDLYWKDDISGYNLSIHGVMSKRCNYQVRMATGYSTTGPQDIKIKGDVVMTITDWNINFKNGQPMQEGAETTIIYNGKQFTLDIPVDYRDGSCEYGFFKGVDPGCN